MRSSLLVLLLLLAATFASAGPLMKCRVGYDFVRHFTPLEPGTGRELTGPANRTAFSFNKLKGVDWKSAKALFIGASPVKSTLPEAALDDHVDDAWTYFNVRYIPLWRLVVAGDARWTDYTVETTVRILSPAPLEGHRPGEVFFNYQWGREAIGSDAGIIVRYQGPDDYYMVRLSSGYGHLELWKTHGGVVQVKPFAFKPETDYHLSVTASGRWIIASVDGQEVLRYADPVEPLLSGRIGLGVRESRVAFRGLEVNRAEPITTAVPEHTPNFHVREWVGRRYIFDGDEPIAWYKATDGGEGGDLCEMKFVPGLMPMCISHVGACWNDIAGRQQGGPLEVTQEGETLAFSVMLTDKKELGFTDVAEWTLSYDPQRGYIWDQRVTVTIEKDDTLSKWSANLLDPLFYQSVAPATDKLPTCRVSENYAVFLRPDGKFAAFPANHEHKNFGATWDKLALKKGGLWAHRIDRWALAIELPADNEHEYYGDYCHWGLDLHFTPTVAPPNTKVPRAKAGDVFTGHAKYYAWTPEEMEKAIQRGILVESQYNPLAAFNFAHTEPVNRFDQVVSAAAGDSLVRWFGRYAIDRTMGRGDGISMRIRGEDIANRTMYGDVPGARIGASFRTGPYLAPRYRIGAWVKSEDFVGTFAISTDFVVYQKKREEKQTMGAVTLNGPSNWTYVSFETELPRQAHYWYLRLDPKGKGTVWVDDVEIVPLAK
ncbi:MAG: hypothetical protein BWY76_01026 [bacterium ADurb.Bin429]|nr:MAG: hypothetical protein BWY76_01026 [bacterium ADurb.Bin429]